MVIPETNSFCGIDINNLQLLGEGCQGKVYRVTQDRVIKVFKRKHDVEDQLATLLCASNSRFFPKVYESDTYSIIMQFIDGQPLNKYLDFNRISDKLSSELVEAIKEFKKLGFTRLDVRLAHVFVQADESIKIIDPRKSFQIIQPYPFLMLKGLKNNKVLEGFYNYISIQYREEYLEWSKAFKASNHNNILN